VRDYGFDENGGSLAQIAAVNKEMLLTVGVGEGACKVAAAVTFGLYVISPGQYIKSA
jgi:hypothetical protein